MDTDLENVQTVVGQQVDGEPVAPPSTAEDGRSRPLSSAVSCLIEKPLRKVDNLIDFLLCFHWETTFYYLYVFLEKAASEKGYVLQGT